jgi:glycosyltransferase involved in cell wall biosynthesis
MDRPLRVSIVWHGLPAYAAYLIRAVVAEPAIDLRVFATEPPEDPQYLAEVLGKPIRWMDDSSSSDLAARDDADICFVSGWAFDACNRFAAAARARGSPVVAMIDNRWRGDLRQLVGSVYFRMAKRKTIDYAWVPGSSAARLCQALGLPSDAVIQGLYGGDGTVFAPSTAAARPPRIGFVGQLIARKGFDLLVEAFKQLRAAAPEYELHAYGRGELAPLADGVPGIVLHPFAKPYVIAEAMRNFRIFVMPSRDDNWPLALHEAALSGCTLVTTREVGNAVELVHESNGIVIPTVGRHDLAAALRAVAAWPTDRHLAASRVSRRLAEPFGPARWRTEFLRLCTAATSGRWTTGSTASPG